MVSDKMASRRFRDWDDDSNESTDDDDDGSSTDQTSSERATNMFANDGSFLELFKKKMEEMQGNADVKNDEIGSQTNSGVETTGLDVANNADEKIPSENQNQQTKKASLHSFVGKRRGGKLLPTGMVKKVRKDDMERESRSDAWAQYMKEVRKYKEQSCEDEGKRRPLVK